MIRTREGALRRYDAIIRAIRRDLAGGLQFGLDWRTVRITFPDRMLEIDAIRDAWPLLPHRRAIAWELVWAPESRVIATVQARSIKAAKRRVPRPYRKYRGEVYARRAEFSEPEAALYSL